MSGLTLSYVINNNNNNNNSSVESCGKDGGKKDTIFLAFKASKDDDWLYGEQVLQ